MSYIYEKKQSTDLFHDLKRMGRDNFSYTGAKALMEWFEELAEGTDTPIEYDPIAFCCDFAEYKESELPALAEEHGMKAIQNDDPEKFIEWLQNQTSVIDFDGGIIIQSF